MVTVVNNPAPASDSGGSGVLIGVIVLVALAVIVWFWGIPMMRQQTSKTEINLPPTQIVVPDKVDVNINQTGY